MLTFDEPLRNIAGRLGGGLPSNLTTEAILAAAVATGETLRAVERHLCEQSDGELEAWRTALSDEFAANASWLAIRAVHNWSQLDLTASREYGLRLLALGEQRWANLAPLLTDSADCPLRAALDDCRRLVESAQANTGRPADVEAAEEALARLHSTLVDHLKELAAARPNHESWRRWRERDWDARHDDLDGLIESIENWHRLAPPEMLSATPPEGTIACSLAADRRYWADYRAEAEARRRRRYIGVSWLRKFLEERRLFDCTQLEPSTPDDAASVVSAWEIFTTQLAGDDVAVRLRCRLPQDAAEIGLRLRSQLEDMCNVTANDEDSADERRIAQIFATLLLRVDSLLLLIFEGPVRAWLQRFVVEHTAAIRTRAVQEECRSQIEAVRQAATLSLSVWTEIPAAVEAIEDAALRDVNCRREWRRLLAELPSSLKSELAELDVTCDSIDGPQELDRWIASLLNHRPALEATWKLRHLDQGKLYGQIEGLAQRLVDRRGELRSSQTSGNEERTSRFRV
ncbi:MAG: hypothetical protein QM775_24445 [Pirellulales bacterium]